LSIIFDPLFIKGGPMIVSKPACESSYSIVGVNLQLTNVLKDIEKGFYSDYDPLDIEEIKTKFPGLGPQEVLDTLVDSALGEFNIKV
jgi:predicted nuclease of restriction endonuclease-like RecB superfamily